MLRHDSAAHKQGENEQKYNNVRVRTNKVKITVLPTPRSYLGADYD